MPQRYILGLLLFFIYINDLPDSLTHSHSLLHDDDTDLLIAGCNIQTLCSKINENPKNLTIWCKTN